MRREGERKREGTKPGRMRGDRGGGWLGSGKGGTGEVLSVREGDPINRRG